MEIRSSGTEGTKMTHRNADSARGGRSSAAPGRIRPPTVTPGRLCRAGLLAAIIATVHAPSSPAAEYYVNKASASCSNVGPGTLAQPYCTIGAALAAHQAPGDTIGVMPGVYREQVTIPASGASGSPLTLLGLGSPDQPVVIDGAEDLSGPANWALYNGNVWVASSVNWSPQQVLEDTVRLVRSTAAPDTLPAGSFRFLAGQGLYVNLGGDNPGNHAMMVGRRLYGVYVSGRSWVAVSGVTVLHADDRGMLVTSASSNVDLVANTVRFSQNAGIQVTGGTAVHIANSVVSDNGSHGIALISGTTGSTIEGNECARNAQPATRVANGLYMFGAPNNLIRGNRFHDNQDTGCHMQSGSNNNVSLQNVSWNNGDHGFDHPLNATGNVQVGDVAYGNYKDGFSFEGNSSGNQMYDCIGVENGLTTNEFDLMVDAESSVGFVSNDNIFWNSTSQAPIKYATVPYASVQAYSASSGEDTRTLQADPKFVNPAAADFHLMSGSPAIDNANSSVPNWPATDGEGRPRYDDPATANQGLGPVAYADRGALEYGPGVTAVPTGSATFRVELAPNPFRTRARLAFSTAQAGPVSVRIFDVNGRLVRRLLDGALPAGPHTLALDGRGDDGASLHSGVYFYRVRSSEGTSSGRFVIMK